jgi:hypothetical protein
MSGDSLLSTSALGVEVEVELLEESAPGWWKVRPVDSSLGDVSFKIGRVAGHSGDRMRGWVAEANSEQRGVTLYARDRGRLPVSDRMLPRHVAAVATVQRLLGGETVPDAKGHVSVFKGMLNRCIRKDQPDSRSGGPPSRVRARDRRRGRGLPSTTSSSDHLLTSCSGVSGPARPSGMRLTASPR